MRRGLKLGADLRRAQDTRHNLWYNEERARASQSLRSMRSVSGRQYNIHMPRGARPVSPIPQRSMRCARPGAYDSSS
eukprot:1702642-Prymnesium_polylepis.1